jgi:glycerate 2-kinase
MKILVASDSFKGTLTSIEIGRIVKQELEPPHEVRSLPVSDGGEGMLEAWQAIFPGRLIDCRSVDPLGREINCRYLLTPDHTAVVESAVAVGLELLTNNERNPMIAGSYGLGLLLNDALGRGAERIYIGLGGSAVNDGGVGMLMALGVRLFDRQGQEIAESGGRVLPRIAAMDTSALETWTRPASFYAVCDVDNPLNGPRGATRVYGPQKGANPEMVEVLEFGMSNLAEVAGKAAGNNYAGDAGTGAAGGLGFCLKSFFNARLMNGMDALIDLTGLEDRIKAYDLIITGEGKLDRQTEAGKVPSGMLRLGHRHQTPVICLCGLSELTGDYGFKKIFTVVPGHASFEESMASPEFYLRKLIRDEVIPWINQRLEAETL